MRKLRLHTGGYYGASFLDSILQLDTVTEEWRQVGVLQRARQYCTVLYCTVQVGVLQQARQYHAMSVVNVTDIEEHCTEY